jgi:peptidylprolyl isomerase
MKVKTGDTVKIEYTGKFNDGEVFDSSEGREPLMFKVGEKQVIPGFEKEIEGMELNEEKTFKIKPADAYGERNDELVKEVPRSALPKDQEPEVGMHLMVQTPEGQQIPATISKVDEVNVTLDVNHPLAGKDLTFTIKVVEISDKPVEKGGCSGGGCSEEKEACGPEGKDSSEEKKDGCCGGC